MKIGVISDTHNIIASPLYMLFADIDLLVHGGDLDHPNTIPELESLCHHIERVAGNCDMYEYPAQPLYRFFTQQGIRFFVVHNLTTPDRIQKHNMQLISELNPHLVIFGHTHNPIIEQRNDHIFINPGQGGRGTALQNSAALIHIEKEQIVCEIYKIYNSSSEKLIQKVFPRKAFS
jgi:putative phosphoesterase